jgi:hypothetical protein
VLAEVLAEHLELRWESIDLGEVFRELDEVSEGGGPVSTVVYEGDDGRI